MDDQAFVADGWRVKLAWTLFGGLAVTGIWNLFELGEFAGAPWILRLVAGSSQLGIVAILAWGLAHRKRPIIEISGDAVRYRSIYWFGEGNRVRLEDIKSASLKGTRLALTTRGGERLRFWLGDLSQRSREAVRLAIEQEIRA